MEWVFHVISPNKQGSARMYPRNFGSTQSSRLFQGTQ